MKPLQLTSQVKSLAVVLSLGLLLVLVLLISLELASEPQVVIAAPLSQTPAFSCSGVTEIPQTECEALVALYNSTDGAHWITDTNWLVPGTSFCNNWYGISCVGGHVQSIFLYNNHLNGGIPSALGNLSGLEELNLDDNQLSGPIPPELGNLSNLQRLFLNGNQLTGSIPPILGSLFKLDGLGLSGNQLSGSIPRELAALGNLGVLFLSSNQLTGPIPPELGNLSNLRAFDVSFRQWHCPKPANSNSCTTSLTAQSVSDNKAQSISYNQLNGTIPPQLGNLVSLQLLLLSSNQLSGAIPAELGNLSNLILLDLSQNQLREAMPLQLGNLSNLVNLDLSVNQLSGVIPTQLGSLSKLESLNLSQNQLSEAIPLQLGDLSNLVNLNLSVNQLGGVIPTQLGSLSKLKTLNLSQNQLSEAIPLQLGNLSNLVNLNLSVNQLSGALPAQLGSLSKLEWLNLSSNLLNGPIPAQLGNLAQLGYLLLAKNQLSEQIPATLGNLANLIVLDLSVNQLGQAIPTQLGNLSSLQALRLSNNQLRGIVPTALANLINFSRIDIVELDYNALRASDPVLIDFLNRINPGWAETQTVPPTEVRATVEISGAVQLTWKPISYTTDGGYYQILHATAPSGPYIEDGRTNSKNSASFTVTGLPANRTYYFIVRTFTPAHDSDSEDIFQQNDLWSDNSQEVPALLTARIAITKTPASQVTYADPTRIIGTDANFVVDVRNTGNVELRNVTVADQQTSDCVGSFGTMAPGAIAVYECSHPNVVNGFSDETIVTGVTSSGLIVSDTYVADVTSRQINLVAYGTSEGTDLAAVRTVTATVFYTSPDGYGGYFLIPVPGMVVNLEVTGGTSYSEFKLSDPEGRVVFTYTSGRPITSATAPDKAHRVENSDFIHVWVDLQEPYSYDSGEPDKYFAVRTVIELAAFSAKQVGHNVMVTWTTAVETDNAGFNLYRASSSAGPYSKLNDQLIAAQGNGTGASYRFVDTPSGAGPFYYKLEDIDYNGVSTLHGPVAVETGPVLGNGAQQIFLPIVKR